MMYFSNFVVYKCNLTAIRSTSSKLQPFCSFCCGDYYYTLSRLIKPTQRLKSSYTLFVTKSGKTGFITTLISTFCLYVKAALMHYPETPST